MSGESGVRPKRGRPPGKNRVPLKAEERRERNARYERDRRKAVDQAFTELANALGIDRKVTPDSTLLRLAFRLIREADEAQSASVESLEAENKKLQDEIEELEKEVRVAEIKDWMLATYNGEK